IFPWPWRSFRDCNSAYARCLVPAISHQRVFGYLRARALHSFANCRPQVNQREHQEAGGSARQGYLQTFVDLPDVKRTLLWHAVEDKADQDNNHKEFRREDVQICIGGWFVINEHGEQLAKYDGEESPEYAQDNSCR